MLERTTSLVAPTSRSGDRAGGGLADVLAHLRDRQERVWDRGRLVVAERGPDGRERLAGPQAAERVVGAGARLGLGTAFDPHEHLPDADAAGIDEVLAVRVVERAELDVGGLAVRAREQVDRRRDERRAHAAIPFGEPEREPALEQQLLVDQRSRMRRLSASSSGVRRSVATAPSARR
jgi:hypothetical protein